jgi:hypothetical protein
LANNPLVYDSPCETMINAFTALLNNGFIEVYSGSQPSVDGSLSGTLLATMTFGSTAFANATASGTGGSAAANTITAGTAGNTGTAGYFALVTSGSSTVGTGSVGTSGADLNFNTLSIVSGAVVSCSAFTVTQPQT